MLKVSFTETCVALGTRSSYVGGPTSIRGPQWCFFSFLGFFFFDFVFDFLIFFLTRSYFVFVYYVHTHTSP